MERPAWAVLENRARLARRAKSGRFSSIGFRAAGRKRRRPSAPWRKMRWRGMLEAIPGRFDL
jgi:hypothetical protein